MHSKTHEITPSKEDIDVAFLLHNCIAKLGKCKATKHNLKHTLARVNQCCGWRAVIRACDMTHELMAEP